jgi:hypothetical protein
VPILLYIKYKFCEIGSIGQSPYDWPEEGKPEPRLTPRIPYQPIIRYLLKTVYELVERHRVKSHIR